VKQMLIVLVIIRDVTVHSFVRDAFELNGHRVVECGEYSQARALLDNGFTPDLVLLDSSSTSLAQAIRSLGLPESFVKDRVCVITGARQSSLRKDASKVGIRHFLMMPLTQQTIDVTVANLRNAGVAQSRSEMAPLNAKMPFPAVGNSTNTPRVPYLEELADGRFFLAASPCMLEIHRQVKLIADVDVSVLITGESGTGKEVIAHLIHKNSKRAGNKFLSVNCAALPTDLLESELFGHRQGAFTGAIKDSPGKFDQADRGTLLLDEIGEMNTQMQAKLLHVLQDGQFTRLGAQQASKVDVRVLAATNVQMENALREKTFREDLYYRLSAFNVNVPPLRERREDIPYLIEEIIRRTSTKTYGSRRFIFSSRLMDAALLCEWRGNLRELRNFVVRTVVMQDSDAAIRELETKISARGEFIATRADTTGVRVPVRARTALKCG